MKKAYELDQKDIEEAVRMYVANHDSSITDRDGLNITWDIAEARDAMDRLTFGHVVRVTVKPK